MLADRCPVFANSSKAFGRKGGLLLREAEKLQWQTSLLFLLLLLQKKHRKAEALPPDQPWLPSAPSSALLKTSFPGAARLLEWLGQCIGGRTKLEGPWDLKVQTSGSMAFSANLLRGSIPLALPVSSTLLVLCANSLLFFF